ncbi:HD domain-containing protein [Pelosinus sp. sgz500959]|uniref:HD domain-containing protein n=1 Tax=Pelosinus sp. sgz500959 TaxID=3242472 RepID=UPI00366C67AA
MVKRVKQVIAALTAKITHDDRLFVNRYLTSSEQILFWGMNLPDQRHVLNVAYTALRLAKAHKNIDINLLVRCALLHDVGKIKGDVSTMDKIITVIGHRFAPRWSKKWGRLGRGNRLMNIRHAFYIYFYHAHRSSTMLKAIGASPKVIELVAKHHETPAEHDPLELMLLRKSDDLH